MEGRSLVRYNVLVLTRSFGDICNMAPMKLLCAFIIILISSSTYGNSSLIRVKNNEAINITNRVSFFCDTESSYSESTISNAEFTHFTDDYFALGKAVDYPVWFKFSINSQSNDPVFLLIKSARIRFLDVFKTDKNGLIMHIDQYSALGVVEKSSFYYPCLELLDANENGEFYVKIKQSSPHQYLFEIGGEEELVEGTYFNRFLSFFFIGAIAILFLYNLILLFYWKTKVYLIYCLYLPFIVAVGTYVNDFPILRDIVGIEITFNYPIAWMSILPLMTLIFSYEYLNFKHDRWVKVLYTIMGTGMILISLSNLFLPLVVMVGPLQIMSSLSFLSCLVAAIYAVRVQKENAVLYLVASGCMILGLLISMAVINGIIPYVSGILNVTYYGTLIEVVLFSAGLAQSIKKDQVELNTMLKRSNERYRSLNSSLESFNYHVSHDLKTVLTNISSLSTMAKKYLERDNHEKMKEILMRLDKISSNGIETVNDLLKLSESEDYIKGGEMSLINIRAFVENVTENYNLKNKIEVDFTKMEFDEIYVHPKSFESVVLNLLTNAIKYSNNPPKMSISSCVKKENYIISFSDNGIGIDMEKNGKELFVPFSRIKNNLKKEGTGIGLYMVQKIIQAHNGSIHVDSALGKGTTFELFLPKKREVNISPM